MSSNPLMMGYEGNRRSGVALAMRHRLSGPSTYGLKGQCAGDEHPAYASGHDPFTFTFTFDGVNYWKLFMTVLDDNVDPQNVYWHFGTSQECFVR